MNTPSFCRSLFPTLGLAFVLACGTTAPAPRDGVQGTRATIDFDADTTQEGRYWDLPFPNDLRLDSSGAADFTGFPNPRKQPIVESFRAIGGQWKGYSTLAVAHFRFDAPLAPRVLDEIPASADQGALLIDIDPASPERGRLFPVVLSTPTPDDYVPENLLSVAARPGFVLHPKRTYAFVIQRSLTDAAGKRLGVPSVIDVLRRGGEPSGVHGASARELYAPLWTTLAALRIDDAEVSAATVFTTGDALVETAALTDGLLAKHTVTLEGVAVDVPASTSSARFCRLTANVAQPQFQKGVPPFDTDGLFVAGPDGLPVEQRKETTPVVIAIPRTQMPAAGFPLLIYFHGSGGRAAQVTDSGPSLVAGQPTAGRGPAWEHAANGIASVGAALPVNPERKAGAKATEYLNLKNPAALRDTFRQGMIEQRLLLKALLTLEIPPAQLADCGGVAPALPSGASAFKFDGDRIIAQGQSMGGMYTNLFSAVEPRVKIAVPTGAGGYWTYFVTQTLLYGDRVTGHPSLPPVLADLLQTGKPLGHLHPVLALLQHGWEPNDPFLAMARVARLPLPGHPVRPIYQPVGRGDEYFPTQLYDAVALAYGHQQAGGEVWPSMQKALALAGLEGFLPYPVAQNRRSEGGQAYTGVVVQYDGDGIEDPHQIYRQLPAVRHQYSCFVKTFLETGIAKVAAPAAVDTPCE